MPETGSRRSFVTIVLWVATTIAGGWLTAFEAVLFSELMEGRSWPVTQGTVVASTVGGRRAYHPEITYEFSVDGHPYRGMSDLDVPGFGTRASRLNVAEVLVSEYPVGRHVTVHYDPTDPARNRLRVGIPHTVFLLLSVGGLALGLGLYGTLRTVLRRRRAAPRR